MSPPVWRPGRDFWFCLAIIWSPSWVISFLAMKFIKKTTGLVVVSLISTLAFSWSASIFVLSKFYHRWRRNQDTNRFFTGYESAGKTIGFTLLFFGNVGLYYFSEKSVACMLTFLFLAFYCLCFLLCIQPYTDFGVLDFLLSGSLNQTLHVFGLRSPYSWLVIIVCIVIAGIRYRLEPAHPSGQATSEEVDGVQVEAGLFTTRPELTKARDDAIQATGDEIDGVQLEAELLTTPPELTDAGDDAIQLHRAFKESIVESTASAPSEIMSSMRSHPVVILEPKESIPAELAPAPLKINVPGELTTVSVMSVTTVSLMSAPSKKND